LSIEIKTHQSDVAQVRIVPRQGFYMLEVIYRRKETQADVASSLYAGIAIGIDNLATLTSNKAGFVPQIVNGRPLKSLNQYYNKRKAELQSILKATRFTARMERLTHKRTRRIDHSLHTASRQIIDLLGAEQLGTLLIGKNPNCKQEVTIGKRHNQQFVCLPHARFIDMLIYKAKLVGIAVILTQESYTSKGSFLDKEPIGKHEQSMGKRVKRGLFRAATGQHSNADVNGSYNIVRKVVPDAFGQRDRGCVAHPVRLHACMT
jgi:putative transposase